MFLSDIYSIGVKQRCHAAWKEIGSVPEWLMGADCKSAGYAYVGSNPTRPIFSTSPCSSPVEHSLGKGELSDSNPDEGIVGGTKEKLNRIQYPKEGSFLMQDRLLLKESSAKEPSGTVSIPQKLKIKVPLKFHTNIPKVPPRKQPTRPTCQR